MTTPAGAWSWTFQVTVLTAWRKAWLSSWRWLAQAKAGGPRSLADRAEALGLSHSLRSEKEKGCEGWEHRGWQGREMFQGCV